MTERTWNVSIQNHVVADNPAAAVVAASASGAANSSDAVPNSVPNAIVSSSSVAAPAAAAKPNNYSIHMNSIDFSNEDLELTDVCRAALGGSSPGNLSEIIWAEKIQGCNNSFCSFDFCWGVVGADRYLTQRTEWVSSNF